jgi:hypothetical protein
LANVGAYISSEHNLLATFGNVGTLTGTYDIPAAPKWATDLSFRFCLCP